jgi:hypothetical protein
MNRISPARAHHLRFDPSDPPIMPSMAFGGGSFPVPREAPEAKTTSVAAPCVGAG